MTWLLRVRKWWPAMLAGLAWVAHLFTVRNARREGEKAAIAEVKQEAQEVRLMTRKETQERSDEIANLDDAARNERFDSLWPGPGERDD